MTFTSTATFIWSVADLLRGDYKQSDYGKVILPFTLLRRLECVLEPTRSEVLSEYESRKSLGSKRKQLSDAGIDEITRFYGAFEEGKICKIFDTADFGYRRITVERPLQLVFYPKDAERIAAFKADKAFGKWSEAQQNEFLEMLEGVGGEKYYNRETFIIDLQVRLTAAQLKLVQKHLGEHDEEAAIIRDKKGNPEPNPDLRDYENVPLKEDIAEYFEREVTPHVPLAWIDAKKSDEKDGKTGIVGYEIPFNRHFYAYVPPRSLEEIDAELDDVTKEIMVLLQEVHS